MGRTVHITDDNFEEEVLKSAVPVLVDFWAEWCGPCRAIAPVLEQISVDYGERLKVGKLNVDENTETAVEFGIRSIPTMILFKDGNPVRRIVGALPKDNIEDEIESILAARITA
jgi:thioredoxin 1